MSAVLAVTLASLVTLLLRALFLTIVPPGRLPRSLDARLAACGPIVLAALAGSHLAASL